MPRISQNEVLGLIRLRISPDAAIAAIEPAGSAIVRAAVWHCSAPSANLRVMRQQSTRNVIAEGIICM